MILYHFTNLEHVAAIMRDGLKPGADADGMLAGERAVWLTEWPSLEVSDDDRAAMIAKGLKVPETWLPATYVRMTIRLEPNTKRLQRYRDWLWNLNAKKPLVGRAAINLQMIQDGSALPGTARWWVYLGTVAPERIALTEGAIA